MRSAASTYPRDAVATRPHRRARYRTAAAAVAIAVVTAGMALPALALGTPELSPGQLWTVVAEGGGSRLARIAVLEIRLPRLVLALAFGAALAVAGAVLQDALRNPLAGPEILGVSAGAAVVMALVVVFQAPLPFPLHPPAALAGGLAGGAVVLTAARHGHDPIRLLLIGAAVTALLNALVFAIVSLGAHYQASLLFLYLLGSNANHTWNDVRLVAPWLAVGLPLALLAARPLNLLRLGDDVAAGLGLSVQRTRLLLLLLAAALAAPVVAVSGPIAWVALVSPHLARRLCGRADARLVLPLAMLIGAVTLVVADQMGRLIFAPQEVPAGAWTTALAGPALLVMLRRGDSEAAS